MSSSRKIILHIGLHKTGTSTIQNVLHANRDFLFQQERVLYPSLKPNLSGPLRTVFLDNPQEHVMNRMAGFTTEEIVAHQKNYLNSLDEEISSCEWDTLLISAEGISNLSRFELAKLREWGEKYASNWTILVCVRHPVDHVRSVMQQKLRTGHTLQRQYEKLPTLGYRATISKVISEFGRQNIRVFDFETAAGSDNGIVGTFAQQAGLAAASGDFLASQTVRANESLSLEAAHILDSLNRKRPIFDDCGRAPRRAGPRRELPYLNRIKGRKFDVPYPVKENIRLQRREDVAWLNETFGLDLYRDITDGVSQAETPEAPVEALSDPAIDSIAEIIGELVTEKAFREVLSRGKAALKKGNLKQAEKMLQTAARLDPDAPQPRKLLKKAAVKQRNAVGGQQRKEPPKSTSRNVHDSLPWYKKLSSRLRRS